jgi:4-nitrophenyl phosphatase
VEIAGLILDLDGTVYRGEEPVAGAPEFIRRLRREGVPFVYATNRANRAPEEIAARLSGYGIDSDPREVVTAALATALYLRPVGSVFVIGEAPLRQALAGAGFAEVAEDPDYVVVGLDRGVDYDKLNRAVHAIRRRARYVATNPDLLIDAGGGEEDIGNGTILAAITAATGVEPLVIGKPHAPLFEIALARLGVPPERREHVLVVGDNLDTDVRGGIRAGLRTAWMTTGVAQPDAGRGVRPDFRVNGYEELARLVFGPRTSVPG